jgi:hypothetical protein
MTGRIRPGISGGPVSRSGRDQARGIQGRGDGAPADELDTYLPRRADDPFYTFGGSAGRSRSSGVITRTGA